MKVYAQLFLLTILLSACNDSENEPLDTSLDSELSDTFEGTWILTTYTLDDGTIKSVPEDVQNSRAVGITIQSEDLLTVSLDLCELFQATYELNNDVLTTLFFDSPEESCDAVFSDVDNFERGELVRRAFFDTQALIALTSDSLTVSTIQNEVLQFVRVEI